MHSILEEILVQKRKEIEGLKERGLSDAGDGGLLPRYDFRKAISSPRGVNMIAEIKFASPSAGILREYTDPVALGRAYEEAGAAAISLLTDKTFFKGDLEDLPRLKRGISLPILRKDFILDEIQMRESRAFGADAVLLIARILSREDLKALLDISCELGMAALTEVHDREDLEKALECGAEIIGINNRNLDTFHVDLKTTLYLAPLIPEGHVVVSESGIKNGYDIRLLRDKGIHAVLVGTSMMTSDDPLQETRKLVHAGILEDGQD